MFEHAAQKRFDLVVFWSLDRFSREGVLETLQHLQRLTSHGVEWFSLREEYLRSVGLFRDAVLAILARIAKQERVRLSERVQAGLARARKEGKQLGRPKSGISASKVSELHRSGMSIREIANSAGNVVNDCSAHPESDRQFLLDQELGMVAMGIAQPVLPRIVTGANNQLLLSNDALYRRSSSGN